MGLLHPCFLATILTPLPGIFLKFGAVLRARSKFANEANAQLAKLQQTRREVQERFENKQVTGMDAKNPSFLTSQESVTSDDKDKNLNHGL
ncbi:Major facilitator superfamily domain general substrate transporter [Penicillium cataractarum]|uniref:Major facilitator superfamily domain general substrate transporter n=1 Tax=Penicillium cataractarum TaxID=2100454 RepID=A0A9W9SH26_9EURO|nr:Major facilitator superfamily domain general substrate transporter [Penicillium cataractarum]KAJ5378230.1 Major facilitator superfamily domain general substrate transporter [Penicillium cataractarum]